MDQNNWQKAVAFHGHECPGLAIGVRACEAAMDKLGIGKSDDEEIVCVTENDACGVDAVQSLLSCTMGKGNLIYRGTGKMAFSFFERKSGKKLRVCMKPRQTKDEDRKKWQQFILEAPLDQVFTFSEPAFELPEKARIFNTVVCQKCGEGVPEHKIHIQEGKFVCDDCFVSYSRGW